MTPGPTKILKIANSGSLVKISTINSGNTFGARYWTDGKCEAPMLPDFPQLRSHPTTHELFWVDECEEVASEIDWETETLYPEVDYGQTPTLTDYRQVLDSDTALTEKREHYALTHFWWLANDPVRHGENDAARPSDFRERLLRLRQLLDVSNPDQRIMAAEVARELGDFSAGEELLKEQFSDDYAFVADLIRDLIAQRDSSVREIVPLG